MSWQDYKGIAGYHQMIAELRTSLYAAFPEANGKVYLYDQLSSGEVDRAANYLGLSNKSLIEQVNHAFAAIAKDVPAFKGMKFPGGFGLQITVTRPDGSPAYLALGMNPSIISKGDTWVPTRSQQKIEQQLTPETILSLAKHTLHEAGHALQNMTHARQRYPVSPIHLNRMIESHVEAFATGLLIHNGAPSQPQLESIASYDATAANQAGYDPSKALFAYLASDATARLMSLSSYYLKDISHVFEKTLMLEAESLGNQKQQMHLAIQYSALQNAYEAWKSNGRSEQEILALVINRRDTILQAEQIIAGNAYLNGSKDAPYRGFKPPEFTLEQALGRAVTRFEKTLDAGDKAFLQSLLNASIQMEGCHIHTDNEGINEPSLLCPSPLPPLAAQFLSILNKISR